MLANWILERDFGSVVRGRENGQIGTRATDGGPRAKWGPWRWGNTQQHQCLHPGEAGAVARRGRRWWLSGPSFLLVCWIWFSSPLSTLWVTRFLLPWIPFHLSVCNPQNLKISNVNTSKLLFPCAVRWGWWQLLGLSQYRPRSFPFFSGKLPDVNL